MADRKNVLKTLETCVRDDNSCDGCPLYGADGWCESEEMVEIPKNYVILAIELLKAQEARVLTLEELIGIYNFRENHSWVYDTPPYLYLDNRAWIGYWVSWSDIVGCLEGQEAGYKVEKYGERWRCWTSRPTDAQREATPWN